MLMYVCELHAQIPVTFNHKHRMYQAVDYLIAASLQQGAATHNDLSLEVTAQAKSY